MAASPVRALQTNSSVGDEVVVVIVADEAEDKLVLVGE